TGTTNGERSSSSASSAAWVPPITSSRCAAARPRSWPSTAPAVSPPGSPPRARRPDPDRDGGHHRLPRLAPAIRRGGRRRTGPRPARPDFLEFIARSIVGDRAAGGPEQTPPADPVQRPVAALIRTPPLLCRGDEPVREVAKRMTAEGASAALVQAGSTLGIVT